MRREEVKLSLEDVYRRFAELAEIPPLIDDNSASWKKRDREAQLRKAQAILDEINSAEEREDAAEQARDSYARAATVISFVRERATMPVPWSELNPVAKAIIGQIVDSVAFVGEQDRRNAQNAFLRLLWCAKEAERIAAPEHRQIAERIHQIAFEARDQLQSVQTDVTISLPEDIRRHWLKESGVKAIEAKDES